jgi:hypothetical protein
MKYLMLALFLSCANTSPAPFVRGEVFDYNGELGTGLATGIAWVPTPREKEEPVHDNTGSTFPGDQPSVGDLEPQELDDSDEAPGWAIDLLGALRALRERVEALEAGEGEGQGERARDAYEGAPSWALLLLERIEELEEEGKGGEEEVPPVNVHIDNLPPNNDKESWLLWLWNLPAGVGLILGFLAGIVFGQPIKQRIDVWIGTSKSKE